MLDDLRSVVFDLTDPAILLTILVAKLRLLVGNIDSSPINERRFDIRGELQRMTIRNDDRRGLACFNGAKSIGDAQHFSGPERDRPERGVGVQPIGNARRGVVGEVALIRCAE